MKVFRDVKFGKEMVTGILGGLLFAEKPDSRKKSEIAIEGIMNLVALGLVVLFAGNFFWALVEFGLKIRR